MSKSDPPVITKESYQKQLSMLKDVASQTVDACLVAKAIAMNNSEVQDLFFKKIEEKYIYKDVYCIDTNNNSDRVNVVFSFDCAPDEFCLIPPSFLAVIHLIYRNVEAIIDPYIPSELASKSSLQCSCEETVSRDVRTCYGATVRDGRACVDLGNAGSICADVPDSIPDGTAVQACVEKCYEYGFICGLDLTIDYLGTRVASAKTGCC